MTALGDGLKIGGIVGSPGETGDRSAAGWGSA